MRKPRHTEEIYRRILTSIWRADWWARLPERPRLLWLRLATAPESTLIPGLVLVDVAAVAASLGWTREDLRIHCAGRLGGFEASFAAACPVIARPKPADLPPARIEITAGDGILVSAAGVVDPVAAVRAVAASLGVSIQLGPVAVPEVVEAEVMPRERQEPIPALRTYAPPAPARPRTREGKRSAVLAERTADVERVFAYHDQRRRAAFEYAGRAPTPVDADGVRAAIVDLFAAGRTVAELETVCDRLYEYVAGAPGRAEQYTRASWWTLNKLKTSEVERLLRQGVGSSDPAGLGALIKSINDVRPAGARALSPLSMVDKRPVALLLETVRDTAAILDTMQQIAAAAGEQERELKVRALVDDEARLVKTWGPALFRLSTWMTAQEVAERWAAGERGAALYVELSRALAADDADADAAKSG